MNRSQATWRGASGLDPREGPESMHLSITYLAPPRRPRGEFVRYWAAVCLVLAAWCTATAAAAQGVPDPATFHGRERMGEQYSITSAVYDYYRELGRSSPRVEYTEYGTSIQGRPLPMLFIGSEETLARLDEIQSNMQRLTGVTERLPESELQRLVAETPAIVWILIVDTDEEAGVEALQEVAYELATGEDARMRSFRDDVLVIMTPLTNPDSHARYVTWHGIYNVSGAALDQQAIENEAHWAMNTDGNAWGNDVNRDFGWFVTPEMGALARVAMQWRPPFWLDIHSGPPVIFLPPFPRPFHPLWSEAAPKWWNAVAERANENFGPKGWSFSSRAGYVGHTQIGVSRSWAMMGPSVAAFLYESFGGRPGSTTEFIRTDGTIATMRMAMDRHKEGIYSLLEVASDRKEELVLDAHERVVTAVEDARNSRVKGLAIPAEGPGVDPNKVDRLIDRLTMQGIEVRRLGAPLRARASNIYALGDEGSMEFPAGTYVVDFVQPMARLARGLLDPSVDFSDPQVGVPFEPKMPYYDVSWNSLTFLFGVGAFALMESPQGAGDLVDGAPVRSGGVEGLSRAAPPYAWVMHPGSEASYKVAIALMRSGHKVRVFTDPTRILGEDFPKGTFAVIRGRNTESIEGAIAELAAEHGARVVAVPGPYTDGGLTLGDDKRVAPIPNPFVAVLADWPITQDHTFGGIRSTLEGDFGFPFSPVMLSTINSADLSKYTAVVLPHAGMNVRGGPNFSPGYEGKLDLDHLRKYVTGGGTLIVTKGASVVVSRDEVLGAGVDVVGWAEHTSGPALRTVWASGQEVDSDIVTWRPGLDKIGPPLLSAGYGGQEFASPGVYPVIFDVDESQGAEVIAHYTEDPGKMVLDGFMLDDDKTALAGRAFVVVQTAGQGRVIYFADEPTFRGYWYGLNVLFLNSLILGPVL